MGDLWLAGKRGGLPAWEQAKAWALREAWKETTKSKYGMHTWIADRLHKVGGGKPTNVAVKDLLAKMDKDDGWHPGKLYGEKRGRKRVLSGERARTVERSAKACKASGGDPTYGHICATCADDVINPKTGKPVDKRAVYTVFKERCYDDASNPNNTWRNRARLSRQALPEDVMAKRCAWAAFIMSLRHTSKWYFTNLVWTDICNSVLPRTEKKAAEQALARKAGKTWMSEGYQRHDRNLRGDKRCLKMNSWDTVRVWWAPVLARGKLHVEMLPANFVGDAPDGAAPLVASIRAALNLRFQRVPPPCVVFVDRGRGFYNAGDRKSVV